MARPRRTAARLGKGDQPVIVAEKHRRRLNYHAVDARRVEVFLSTLAETGSQYAAAEAATPWARSHGGGLESFRKLAERDPEFKARWDAALTAALGKVEQAIMTRALTPVRKPIFWNGEQVGHEDKYDNRLLVQLARKLNPRDWNPQHKVEHSGAVETPVTFDLSKLSPEELEMALKLTEGQLRRQAAPVAPPPLISEGRESEDDDEDDEED